MKRILYAGLIWGAMFVLAHIGFFNSGAVKYILKSS